MRPACRTQPTPERKTLPTRHLYQGHDYTVSNSTDIRKLFERVRAEQAAPANVSPIKKRSAKP